MITMYYDDTCMLCRSNAHAMQQKAPDKILITPAQSSLESLAKHHISQIDVATYVIVADEQGLMHKGMDAVRLLYKTANIPCHQLLYLPIIKQLGDFIYPIVAKNRHKTPKWLIKLLCGQVNHCDDGVCHISPKERLKNNS